MSINIIVKNRSQEKWINIPIFLILVFYLLTIRFTHADTLFLEENFNFTGLLNANGWNTHSASGTNSADTTTGLNYMGYPASGIGNAALLDNIGEDLNRTFTIQNSGILYVSFLVKVNSKEW